MSAQTKTITLVGPDREADAKYAHPICTRGKVRKKKKINICSYMKFQVSKFIPSKIKGGDFMNALYSNKFFHIFPPRA
jgi:hypothetical protein